jgi:hypothetical protein
MSELGGGGMLKVPSVENIEFAEISVSGRKWHILALYLFFIIFY